MALIASIDRSVWPIKMDSRKPCLVSLRGGKPMADLLSESGRKTTRGVAWRWQQPNGSSRKAADDLRELQGVAEVISGVLWVLLGV